MFDRSGVSELLLAGRYFLEKPFSKDASLNFEDDIAVLQSYDLVSFQENGDIGMHALVQLATRDWLERTDTIAVWQSRMTETLSEKVPKPDIESWNEWLGLLPHVKSMEYFKPSRTRKDLCTKWAGLLWHECDYLIEHGRFTEAQSIPSLYLEVVADTLGQGPREYLRGQYLTACLAENGNRISEAVAVVNDIIPLLIEQFGHDDSDTQAALLLKATCHIRDGMLAEAEDILETMINSPGYTGVTELAYCCEAEQLLSEIYVTHGEFQKATDILERAVTKSISLLGEYHPETLSVRVNQSRVMYNQRHYAETEALSRDLYEAACQHVDPDHPIFMVLRSNMCSAMFELGRGEKALEIEKELLERYERVTGPSSQLTLLAMANYATSCINQGQYDVGIHWIRQAINVKEQVHGPVHIQTLESKHDLAWGLEHIGADEELSCLYEELCRELNKQSDLDNNILVLEVESSRAEYFARTGRLQEALEMSKSTVERTKKLLPNRSEAISILIDRACILCKQGQIVEGEQIFNEARAFGNKIHGQDSDLSVRQTQRWLSAKKLAEAKILLEEGKLEEAQDAFNEGLAANFVRHFVTSTDQNLITKRYEEEFEACKKKANEQRKGVS